MRVGVLMAGISSRIIVLGSGGRHANLGNPTVCVVDKSGERGVF